MTVLAAVVVFIAGCSTLIVIRRVRTADVEAAAYSAELERIAIERQHSFAKVDRAVNEVTKRMESSGFRMGSMIDADRRFLAEDEERLAMLHAMWDDWDNASEVQGRSPLR